MIVTTAFDVPGYDVESVIGVVRGIVVRSPGIAQGLMGGLRQIFGGNIIEYVQVCERARNDAYEIMVQHAIAVQADAIIGMRYDATEFAPSTTEVLAYGTAVRLIARQD
jgi:uncharacterized protein YbjQ (UPF0145 family)